MKWNDVKLVNCAACRAELLGESMRDVAPTIKGRELVAGRVRGRPYCGGCLPAAREGTAAQAREAE